LTLLSACTTQPADIDLGITAWSWQITQNHIDYYPYNEIPLGRYVDEMGVSSPDGDSVYHAADCYKSDDNSGKDTRRAVILRVDLTTGEKYYINKKD